MGKRFLTGISNVKSLNQVSEFGMNGWLGRSPDLKLDCVRMFYGDLKIRENTAINWKCFVDYVPRYEITVMELLWFLIYEQKSEYHEKL